MVIVAQNVPRGLIRAPGGRIQSPFSLDLGVESLDMKKLLTIMLLVGFVAGCAGHEIKVPDEFPKPKRGEIVLWGWRESQQGMKGFNLYMSEVKTGEFRKLNQQPIEKKFFVIGGKIAGQTYFFKLTNVTLEGHESKPSKVWDVKAAK